ncbi:substrate-binding domain-containing protein, partial [Actinomadura kijaniata]|uniref:substrate-binding domain-containing protein n=1 Tax=Actinomadura kijaniata TaxID=46161 RepID=UPI0031CE01E9
MVVEAPGRAPGAAPNPFTGPGSLPGPGALASRRLRRSRDRLTLAVAAALGLGLLLGGGGWVVAVRGPSCDPAALLTVTADPAVAPAATAVAASLNQARRKAGRCAAVKVSAGRSGETAALFRTGRGTPDVWIPDSSLWLDMLPRAIRPAAGRPPASVASSPLVFVLTTADARRHRSELDRRAWAAFGPGVAADRVFHAARAATPRYLLRVPDPSRTGTGMLTLLALESTVHATTARGVTARFAATMRTVRTLPDGTDLGAALTGVGEDGPAEVAVVPEHRAWRHTGTRAVRPVETVYPARGAPYLDFPFFVAARGAADGRTAAALLAELRGADGTAQLRRVGLRSAARTAPAPARPGEDDLPYA